MNTPQIDELIIFLGQISGAVIAITAALAILHRVFFKKLTDGGSSLRDVANRIEKNQVAMQGDIHEVREKVDDHIVWHLNN
jgi:hypothetical protein